MNLTQLFANINSAYRGADDDPPLQGTPDYTNWLNTTNRKISEWARDGKNTWKSLFLIEDAGTVSAGTQDYDLEDNLLQASDRVILTTTDGQELDYRICEPQERDRYYHSAYISGAAPQVLTFSDTIQAGDTIDGADMQIPGYYLPDPVANPNDLIPVDDPYWLVMAVAAELAFNDITYAAKAADLNAKANNLYAIMASNNRRGTNGSPKQLRTSVIQIPSIRTSRISTITGDYQ